MFDRKEELAVRVWDRYLTAADQAVFAASGTGTVLGIGLRPALLVVDVTYAFTGHRNEDILQSIATWPDSCGPNAWAAIPHIRLLVDTFHASGLPVFYSRTAPLRAGGSRALHWRSSRTSPAVPVAGVDGSSIVTDIAPDERDIVVTKIAPSAFFGTDLRTRLTSLDVDTVVICGATTSGCVRATVVDAFSHGLLVVVAEEATFDRGEVSHAVSLFDMDAKYADVMPVGEIVQTIESRGKGRSDQRRSNS